MLADDGTGALGDDDGVTMEYLEEDGRQFELLCFYVLIATGGRLGRPAERTVAEPAVIDASPVRG